jgi:formylglycine-generating enzyme required for sulfatase activity
MKRMFFIFLTITLFLMTVFVACKKNEPITSVKLDKATLFLGVEIVETITVEIFPIFATNKNVSWTTSNSSVVTVEGNNTETGLVTGKSEGEAIITVTTEDGKFTATCIVTVIKVDPEMVFVEGGTFTMGCTDEQGGDCFDWEKPAHQVTLSSYHIAKYPVTQREWRAIMGYNPSVYKHDEHPVESVYWDEVHNFIKKINEATGKNYRLPTEAEWEYAARGGNKSEGFKWSGSDNPNAVGWYKDEYSDWGWTHPVGRKMPNELGIYDMSGNVWEWCSDWLGDYTDEPRINPIGPQSGTLRIIRGSCIQGEAKFARVSARGRLQPNLSGGSSVGFRLVHPVEP